MQLNRALKISVGGSRKETNWKPQEWTWAQFIERLRRPGESEETLEEYKAMKKSQQDDLKDVGGFVGGAVRDGRRKLGNILSRCLVTLDADNIPSGGTADIINRVKSIGCAFVIYSTRKHEEAAPRLRIIFPSDRDMLPDEYEPVARKLANLIDPSMGIFDPTTFEIARFMYWPSLCKGAQYILEYGGTDAFSVSGVLDMYRDWKNMAEWPQAPSSQVQIVNRAKRQGDPREKPKVVGAFCRVYDIPDAISRFLPDVYEECGEGRYTYKDGSTTGGAVLYDNGLFLYSHHATDPAGGRLCNAFDLVRIHKFGGMDAECTEDTPVNRLPSYAAMIEWAMLDEAVKMEHFKTATACFTDSGTERAPYPDFKIGKGGSITLLPTCDNLKTLLRNEGIQVAYDVIKREIRVDSKDQDAARMFNSHPNGYSNLLVHCTDQLTRDGIRVSSSKVHEWMVKIADDNKRNEALSFLRKNFELNQGARGIDTLFRCLDVAGDEDFYRMLLRKWLCQGVAMAHNEEGRFGADGVLVLKGPHGIGKTTFFRKCCVIGQNYFAEGAQLDGSKDKLMETTACWIGELGELPRSMKDVDSLKAFITNPNDKFRVPYGKKDETYPRFSSYGATTNSDEFLKEQGERRFWVIDVKNIDLAALNHVDFNAVWAEAMGLYQLLGGLSFRLTCAERAMLQSENKQFQIMTEEEKILREKLDWNQPREEWQELTATALGEWISPIKPLSGVKVGRALARIGYKKDCLEYPMRTSHGCPVYKIPKRIIGRGEDAAEYK